jgi:hypothetical protein
MPPFILGRGRVLSEQHKAAVSILKRRRLDIGLLAMLSLLGAYGSWPEFIFWHWLRQAGLLVLMNFAVSGTLLGLCILTSSKVRQNAMTWFFNFALGLAFVTLLMVWGLQQTIQVTYELSLQQSRQQAEQLEQLTRTERYKAQVRTEVLRRLKDPESAQIRELELLGDDHACVLINAKNSYGGYNGFHWMNVSRFDKSEVWRVVDTDDFHRKVCEALVMYKRAMVRR